jgi:hypothetical protein
MELKVGYYIKGRPGWQGLLGKILYVGGLVSIGIEIGGSTGRRVADEVFSALPLATGSGSGGASGASASPAYQVTGIRQPGVGGIIF